MDVLCTFYIFFGTNLLIQCQVPVPVFSVFLTLFRSDFRTESKRKKNPEMIFSRTEEDQGAFGPSHVGSKEPTSRHSATRGRRRWAGLWPPWPPPHLDPWLYIPKNSAKNQGSLENTFPPPQASVSARYHLETLPGALPEGTLELEGFFFIIIAPPMTRE